MRFEMGALSPSDLSPEAQRAKGEGTRRIEGAADVRPQADLDTESRRGFLRNVFAGAGAGAAMTYAYGRPAEAAASEVTELAADDPNAPEVESSLVTEGSLDKLRLAEQVAKMIESGAITPTYVGGTRETLAGAGVLAVAASEKGEKPVQGTRRGFLGKVAGLLGGTILVSAPEFARAQELALVTYNINSNERAGSIFSKEEAKRIRAEEGLRGRKITLEEFTRMASCESPRGARLWAQHEEFVRYNKEVMARKRARGEKGMDGIKTSPVAPLPGWYHKASKVPGSDVAHSFFRLRNQVLVPDGNGGHRKVYKHYGVLQVLDSDTRQPHCLFWAGHLGENREAAEEAMEKQRGEY